MIKFERILIIITVLVIVVSCSKDKASYPDCFKEAVSSPYQTGAGCGNILATVKLDNNKLVSIYLDEQALDLKTACKSFKIENDTNNIEINYYTYANHPDSVYFSFCSDIIYMSYGSKITWKAISGSITVAVSRERSYREDCEDYLASIELNNIKFRKENSMQDTTITTLIIRDKTVGLCIP